MVALSRRHPERAGAVRYPRPGGPPRYRLRGMAARAFEIVAAGAASTADTPGGVSGSCGPISDNFNLKLGMTKDRLKDAAGL